MAKNCLLHRLRYSIAPVKDPVATVCSSLWNHVKATACLTDLKKKNASPVQDGAKAWPKIPVAKKKTSNKAATGTESFFEVSTSERNQQIWDAKVCKGCQSWLHGRWRKKTHERLRFLAWKTQILSKIRFVHVQPNLISIRQNARSNQQEKITVKATFWLNQTKWCMSTAPCGVDPLFLDAHPPVQDLEIVSALIREPYDETKILSTWHTHTMLTQSYL